MNSFFAHESRRPARRVRFEVGSHGLRGEPARIEGAFSILAKHVLARGSFPLLDELRQKIYEYLVWFNQSDHPFHWTYRPKSWSRK